MSDKQYPSNLYLESAATDINFAKQVSVEPVVVMARELLALRNQPVSQHYKLPDGWRLVPDEPTEEMMRAMHQAQDMWPSAHCDNMRETQMSFARPRYIAALATAPKPPTDSTT